MPHTRHRSLRPPTSPLARAVAHCRTVVGDRAGLVVAVLALALASAAVGRGVLSRHEDPWPAGKRARLAAAEPSAGAVKPGLGRLDPQTALALVLRADPTLATEAGEALALEAKTVLRLERDAVLIAASQARAPASTVPGALGIFYLRDTAVGPEVAGAWPRAAIGAPNAAAPAFSVTDAFGQWPVVVARSQEKRSGVVCERTQLIELRPTGPVVSAPFVSGLDARGAGGGTGRSWVGRLRDVGFGGGFTLDTGQAKIRFHRIQGRYAPANGVKPPHC